MEENRVFLLPGEYHVSRTPTNIATLLGSCVAVCLKHRQKSYGAMNHFLLPEAPENCPDSQKGRYGNTSIETICWLMNKLDNNHRMLEAKIFGGAAVVQNLNAGGHIGKRNIQVARQILEAKGIKITEEDTGGTSGRRIYFNTATGMVTVRQVRKTEEADRLAKRRQDIASRKTRILVVDDSALVRRILCSAISETFDMEVCGEAADAFEARDQILSLDPDVISLDIIMPRLDGLQFLKKLTTHFPKPVVICSTIAKDNSEITRKARDYGAVDVVDKDTLRLYQGMDVVKSELIPKLRRAAGIVVRKRNID